MVAMPRTITGAPQSRQRPCHRHNQQPPSATSTTPTVGSLGMSQILPGSTATPCATRIVKSMPQPMGIKANHSRWSGIKRQAIRPQGSVHIAEIGTAMTLASGE
jgi:hypothetical protein